MPARPQAAFVHGTSPSMAKSTLNAPGPCRYRRYARATRAGQPVAEDVGRSARAPGRAARRRRAAMSPAARTRTPVWILPPRSSSSERQRVGDRLGAALGDRPSVAVAGGDDGHARSRRWSAGAAARKAWAATPPKSARALSVRQRASRHRRPAAAPRGPKRSKRERVIGARAAMGRIRSSARSSKPGGATGEHPPPAARRRPEAGGGLVDRSPQQPGLARSRAGGRSRSPATATAGRDAPGRACAGTGEPTPIGWNAEQWSWSTPGR